MLPGTSGIDTSLIGIIALVPDTWSEMWQVRHHLLSRIARECTVVWMNPGHHWREILHQPRVDSAVPVLPDTRLYVQSAPVYLPRFYGHARLDAITLSLRLKAARDSLVSRGVRYVVLYLWRPEFALALPLVRHDLSCYHIDDEYSFSTTAVGTSENELTLLKQVDQVLIHSGTMLRAKGGINPHTAHVPNGVDYERYSTEVDEPADLARIPHPRIGYTGWLKPQMDWLLLQTLVRRHSEWSFVLIGPEQRHPEVQRQIAQLRQAGNVHLMGGRPTAILHAYTQHFDVCLMPYVLDSYTEFIYPVKVHEYLATGNPVVATPLPNLREFSDVLSLACNPDEWSAAITAALESRSDERMRAARRLVAERHDWSALSKRVVSIFEARLSGGVGSS